MAQRPEPKTLMAQTYELPRGPRVRLRLATPRDERSIQGLAERSGAHVDAGRLVHFDPRERSVICATTLLDTGETVVGVGAAPLHEDAPQLVLVDDRLTDGLAELLCRALVSRSNAVQGARAA